MSVQTVALREKALGPNHAVTASTLSNLGSLLQSTGRLAEAERVERRAVRIFEEKLGRENIELGTAYTKLADLLWAKGDRASAEIYYRRTIAIDESIYGDERRRGLLDLFPQ